MKPIGIYIHIPFCKQKCYYCDFISYPHKEEWVEKYMTCLQLEIEAKAKENQIQAKHGLEEKYKVMTIYIGGGTPSYIEEEAIFHILNSIKKNYDVDQQAEVTIEVNPGTVTQQKLETYLQAGVNRISIGLQAKQERLLKELRKDSYL